MDKLEIIKKLNDDLINEYEHMHFYMQSAFLVTGFHREELREFLWKSAQSEMEHIKLFADLIIGLGGIPTTSYQSAINKTTPKEILEFALILEKQVVKNYLERMKDAEELGGVDGRFIEIFLEEQMMDSRTDIDHITRMLVGE